MKSLPPILATLAIVLLLLGGYVGAYLGMGEEPYHWNGSGILRIYRSPWAGRFFRPAGWVESKLRGVEVVVTHRSPA